MFCWILNLLPCFLKFTLGEVKRSQDGKKADEAGAVSMAVRKGSAGSLANITARPAGSLPGGGGDAGGGEIEKG